MILSESITPDIALFSFFENAEQNKLYGISGDVTGKTAGKVYAVVSAIHILLQSNSNR